MVHQQLHVIRNTEADCSESGKYFNSSAEQLKQNQENNEFDLMSRVSVIYLFLDRKCSSSILGMVDNYGLLCLDIVWCYLCLQHMSSLPDAGQHSIICCAHLWRLTLHWQSISEINKNSFKLWFQVFLFWQRGSFQNCVSCKLFRPQLSWINDFSFLFQKRDWKPARIVWRKVTDRTGESYASESELVLHHGSDECICLLYISTR